MPDVLLIPENQSFAQYSYSAPFDEIRMGATPTPQAVRDAYPNSFTVLCAQGVNITQDQLTTAVQNGDILLVDGWYYNNAVAQAQVAYATMVPDAVTSLNASATSSSQVSLQWSSSPKATGYVVQYSDDGLGQNWQTLTSLSGVLSTSYVTTAQQGRQYRVIAQNGDGVSGPSAVATAQLLPVAPTNFSVVDNSAFQVTLSWTDNANNETSYNVQRATDPSFTSPTSIQLPADSTTYTDSVPADGTTYYYRLCASCDVGDSDSALASISTPVVAPTDFSASAINSNSISLSWTGLSYSATEYHVLRSTTLSFDLSTTVALDTTYTTYVDTGLVDGVTYYYCLCAVAPTAESDSVFASAQLAVSAPSNLVVTATSGQTNLSWKDNSASETAYIVQESTNSLFVPLTTITVDLNANTTTWSDPNVLDGMNYYYRVWALGPSLNVSATIQTNIITPTAAPTSFKATVAGTNGVSLSWLDNSTTETGYVLQRATNSLFASSTTINLPAKTTGYTDSVLDGTAYYYRVFAQGAVINSASANVTVSTALIAPTSTAAAVASTTQINLTWSETSATATSMQVEQSIDGVTFTSIATLAASARSYSVTGLQPATKMYFRIRAVGPNGSAVGSIVNATTPRLNSPWSDGDIGGPKLAGTAKFNGTTYSVSGSGADIYGTADQFHYVYRTWTGDGTLTARVTSVSATNNWTKAGIMMRESLSSNARNAAIFTTPKQGVNFQDRQVLAGTTKSVNVSAPVSIWLRLTRKGSVITAYQSTNGTTWTKVYSDTVSMSSTIYVGMALTSHDNTKLATATFDNVSITT